MSPRGARAPEEENTRCFLISLLQRKYVQNNLFFFFFFFFRKTCADIGDRFLKLIHSFGEIASVYSDVFLVQIFNDLKLFPLISVTETPFVLNFIKHDRNNYNTITCVIY